MASGKESFKENQWVWVSSSSQHDIHIGAKIIKVSTKQVQVNDDDGKKSSVPVTQLRLMDHTSHQSVEDMILLQDHLTEAAILRNLQQRFIQGHIYTYTGSILVAVNPYKVLPIYTPQQIEEYRGRKFGELPPHIFAIGDNAYHNMKRHNASQAIIISGESGSGKTENTTLLLQFFATLSGQHSWIEEQILESNPLLEAFGNAKTVKNNNSSRFGKYLKIFFDDRGSISGAFIKQYLVEKSRIVFQTKEERNYHIFYCLLEGLSASEKDILELTSPKDYHYLNQGGSLQADGRNDRADYMNIKSAMKVLMFTDEEIWFIMKTLSAILHLGNLEFTEKVVDHNDTVVVKNKSQIASIAKNLLISKDQLEDGLTKKYLKTQDEMVSKPLNHKETIDVRDAFSKAIYGKLFLWLVDKINSKITSKNQNRQNASTSIGMLDIFGFEHFENNRFEQLCINYANEHLQQFFITHIFTEEQEDYKIEGIEWTPIDFVDNKFILKMLDGEKLSILNLIDEEVFFPNGNDESLLVKLHKNHVKNANYFKPQSEAKLEFGIKHFAGLVKYTTEGCVEKNKDTFSSDLLYVIANSKSPFISDMFQLDVRNVKKDTVISHFKQSLGNLIQELNECQPFFVRCIKPNNQKKPMVFDRKVCLTQIRSSGMNETLHIKKNGYPVRPTFSQFIDRYRCIAAGIPPAAAAKDLRSAAKQICQVVLEKDDYLLGSTKVFLKDGQDAYLEQQRQRCFDKKIVLIQKVILGFIERKKFRKMKLQENKAHDPSNTMDGEKMETTARLSLKRYSTQYFNPRKSVTNKEVGNENVGSLNDLDEGEESEDEDMNNPGAPCSFTSQPITGPLLRKSPEQHTQLVCDCFIYIMKYMGDFPTSQNIRSTFLTDRIFKPLLENEILTDEIYCQIMNQLTDNPRKQSIRRGFELLWLLTGLCAPSKNLCDETRGFLVSWNQEKDTVLKRIISDCSKRLSQTLKHGRRRRCAPHIAEVLGVQESTLELFYRIRLPDGSSVRAQVDSCSRARDVCKAIIDHYKISSLEGFSLYVDLGNKTLSVPMEEFVFDFASHDHFTKSGEFSHSQINVSFHIKKKLWHNVLPGRDEKADNLFYYNQEVQNYLAGYHKCSHNEALTLASLIYLIKYRHIQVKERPNIRHCLDEIVPKYMLNTVDFKQWEQPLKSLITDAIKDQSPLKSYFLNAASKWPTFGSEFFHVKYESHPNLEAVFLAIGRKGIHIIEENSKGILEHIPYDQVLNYTSSDMNSFQLTAAESAMKPHKYLFETTFARNITDLITSYLSLLNKSKKKSQNVKTLQKSQAASIKVILESTSL